MKTLLMGLAMAASLAVAAWGEVWPLEPGVGVGPVKLGQHMLTPLKFLTAGEKKQGSLGGLYLTYKEGIQTECQSNQITQIVVTNTTFTTAKGYPQKIYYAWPSRGVGVITEGGKIIQFEVFPRR